MEVGPIDLTDIICNYVIAEMTEISDSCSTV
jgi:hypothetical protein